jgi:hypothetical protein
MARGRVGGADDPDSESPTNVRGEIEIRERLVVVETKIQGLAAASTILSSKTDTDIITLRTSQGDHGQRLAKIEAVISRLEVIEDRVDKVRDDVTGRHRLVLTDPPPKPSAAPAARHDSALLSGMKLWTPIVLALIAVIGTLINYILHQH